MKICTCFLVSVLGLNFYAITENSTQAKTVYDEPDVYNGFYSSNSALVDDFVKNLRQKLENAKDKQINKAEYQLLRTEQLLRNCIAIIKKWHCTKNDSVKMTKDDLTDMLKGTSYFDDINVKDSETAKKYVNGVCKALGCETLNKDVFKSAYLSCSIISILLKVAEIKKKIVDSSNDVIVSKLKTSLAELVKNNIVPITNKEIRKLNSTK